MDIKLLAPLLVVSLWMPATLTVQAAPSLRIGLVQVALEPTLAENQSKIARFIRQAKAEGCRVVVFPETALYWQPEATREQIDAAVASLRKVVADSDIYALIGGPYKRNQSEKPFERLLVVGPAGEIIQTYNKMWSDARFGDCPGLFEIDGVPCAAAICADRWIRSVEELPAMAGAKILFEVSNNYDNEWLADREWFWYVPRAIRNGAFVVFVNTSKEDRAQKTPGHGHSAVIAPDGTLLGSLGVESDQLLVREIDLSQATHNAATARRSHPLFNPFWDRGVAILEGNRFDSPPHQPLVAPQIELKIAAAQMACSAQIDENAARIVELIYEAREGGADVVVFPELALSGANPDDIRAIKPADLEPALAMIQKAADQFGLYVVVGMPWREEGRLYNTAAAIGPDGRVLTRYRQLVVDRPELFAASTSTKAMWLEIKGVPAVITIGRDALWSELAELAAIRGAQVHLHLAYDRETSPQADLRRKQLWANLASYRTFTATVNAASPRAIPNPSSPASGGSTIWDDFHRGQNRKLAGYGPYSAVAVAEAGRDDKIIYATQKIPAINPQFRILTEKTNPQMTPWLAAGAVAIYSELAPEATAGNGPYVSGKFQGRIAYSADGNHNDPDDWAASPVALAIFAECGLKDRVVHFDYNCILPRTDPEWEKIHATSVLGTAERYGYPRAVFHDCRKDVAAAVASLARAIDDSSAENPLYFIVAGPMEVPFLAIQKSQPEKRRHVYCISHSRWNDGFARMYSFTHTKRSVIETGVHWVQIRDQNRLLSTSRYGVTAPAESWQPYHWMRDSDDARVRWLWERLQVSTRPDPSDAGMAWFLATGDEDCDPAKLKRLLDDNVAPQPLATRRQVRLEAENFRELSGVAVEDTNDRDASHRLQVVLKESEGRLATRFNQPYAPAEAKFEVEVRCRCDSQAGAGVQLVVDGVKHGRAWQPAAGETGWIAHKVSGVPIHIGSEIALEARGTNVRIDYVQINH